MKIFLVGIGGILGSISRFLLIKWIAEKINRSLFPYGTFLVNIIGSFLLGIVTTISTDKNILLFSAEGFIASFTTFSTFIYEGYILFKDNENSTGALYIGSSIIFGLISFIIGILISRLLII